MRGYLAILGLFVTLSACSTPAPVGTGSEAGTPRRMTGTRPHVYAHADERVLLKLRAQAVRRAIRRASRDAQRARAAAVVAAQPVSPQPVTPPPGDYESWANQPFSIRVANCESGGGPTDHSSHYDGNAHLRDPNGHDGKWQFAPETWASVGGTGNAADAPEWEQDMRAYALWQRDGWGQWTCSQMVG